MLMVRFRFRWLWSLLLLKILSLFVKVPLGRVAQTHILASNRYITMVIVLVVQVFVGLVRHVVPTSILIVKHLLTLF